jgi:hypothetical protein
MNQIDDSILKMIESNTSMAKPTAKPTRSISKMAGGIIQPFPINSTSGPLGYKVSPTDPKKAKEFQDQQKKAAQTEFSFIKDTASWKAVAGNGNLIIPTLL